MPDGTSAAACKLLKGLLNRNVQARFGTARSTMFEIGGVAGLKQHQFFSHLNWDMLERKEVEPPATFAVQNDSDAAHFHEEFTTMPLPRSVVDMSSERFLPRRVASDAFRGFSFVHDDFLLPTRDEQEEKSYWDAVEEDGESASECASSKMGDEDQVQEVEPLKKKRPPRKRKKKKDNATETASTTPLGSAVNTPEPSVSGDAPFGVQETQNADLDEEAVKDSIGSLENLSIGKAPEAVLGEKSETVTTLRAGEPGSISVSPAPHSATSPTRPPAKAVNDSWQSVAKEKGKKKQSNKADVKTPRKEKAFPPQTPSRPIPGASLQSTLPRQIPGASPPPVRKLQQSHVSVFPSEHSTSSPGWGPSLAKQQAPFQPQRPPPPAPSGSTDWRQHSMRGSPRTAPKPKVAANVQPETIVWPSLSSSELRTKQNVQPPPSKKPDLSGAWAKRIQR